MRPSWKLLAGAALLVAPFSSARADLPECASTMLFGVDCRIGTAEAGGISLSGFSQAFGGTGTRTAGGNIAFEWMMTSASTSTLRMTFDPASAEALRVALSASPSSFGGGVSGTETLTWSLSAFAGGSILSATLGQGTPSTLSTCATSLTGASGCGVVSATVAQSIDGLAVGSTETAVNASGITITRTSAVSVSRGAYLPWYSYTERCGSFGSTCTRTQWGYFGGGYAETPDMWVYEFALSGTGAGAIDPDVPTAVPEPPTIALVVAGALMLLTCRRLRARSA